MRISTQIILIAALIALNVWIFGTNEWRGQFSTREEAEVWCGFRNQLPVDYMRLPIAENSYYQCKDFGTGNIHTP